MKATLLFAALSMVFAMPRVSAKTELETLRARCAEQEQKIRQLEDQLHPQRGSRSETPAPASRTTVAPAASTSSSSGSYMVKPGDSVEKIARRNHCSVSSLNKINGLKSSSIIHPGQHLKLPTDTAIAATTTPAKPVPPVKSPAADTPAAPSSVSGKTHKIKQGETYSSISRKYRIPVDTLVAANPGVKATALRPGLNIRLSSNAAAPAEKHTTPTVTEVADKPATPKTPTIKATKEPDTKPIAKTTPVEKHTSTVIANSGKPGNSEPVALRESTTTPINNGLEPAPSSGNPAVPAIAESPKAPASPSPNPNPEKKIRSVKIEDQMTYGQFAAKHGTDANRLNDLNGLDLTTATVLAKGSELYVPAQP